MVMCVFTRYTRFAISLRTKELMSLRRRSSCLCSLYLAFQPHSNHDTVLSNQAFELTFKRLNVRRAQWLASKHNKERLVPKSPESGKRRREINVIRFKAGDRVYLRAEALVHNKLGNTRVRDLVPDPNDFVPMKWRFKWTGPHLVKERKGERACVIWHSERHK